MDQQSSGSLKLAPKKARQRRVMLFSLIYFFAPFFIFYIPHNYVIPQAMPHAIPQTHSSCYPRRVLCVDLKKKKLGNVTNGDRSQRKLGTYKPGQYQPSEEILNLVLQKRWIFLTIF